MGEGLHSQGGCFAQAQAVSYFVQLLLFFGCTAEALATNSSKIGSLRRFYNMLRAVTRLQQTYGITYGFRERVWGLGLRDPFLYFLDKLNFFAKAVLEDYPPPPMDHIDLTTRTGFRFLGQKYSTHVQHR